jgi:hypothetical protein
LIASESDESEFESEDSEDDDESEDSDEDDSYKEENRNLAYLPCAAHNLQLVLKDGFKLSDTFTKLLNMVSKNIVSKAAFSHHISESLRDIGKKFHKKNATRWSSTLFMARSVISIKPIEYTNIKNSYKGKSAKEKKSYKNFDLMAEDRKMLEELVHVLEAFEWVTDEFQSNQVSISRVYPCIEYLRGILSEYQDDFLYVTELRSDLLESLNKRFGSLIQNDVFLVSTFLGNKWFK